MKTKYLKYLLDNGHKIKNCTTCTFAGNYFNNVIMLGETCSRLDVVPFDYAICDLYEPHYGKIKYFIKEKQKNENPISAKYRDVKDGK